MPELPDVESFKTYFDSTALHKKITDIDITSKKVLGNINGSSLKSELEGKKFTQTYRHGKYLFASLSNNSWIMFHFGMTGNLRYFKKIKHSRPHDRIIFSFSNGYHLTYVSQRLLGRVSLISNPDNFIKMHRLGPDALRINLDSFSETFSKKRSFVKTAIMEQKVISGIGNIYADEILFQAGIHPKTKVNRLSNGELKKLFSKIKEVLSTAVDLNADVDKFPSDYLIANRKEGKSCSKCGGKINKIKISNRSTYFCPECQEKKDN